MKNIFEDTPSKPPENRPWDFVFIPENIGKKVSIYDCFYCGLKDGAVECGGMFYCPNGLCDGPGSGWFNRTLKSYKDEGKTYSIDNEERVEQWKKRCEDSRAATEKKDTPPEMKEIEIEVLEDGRMLLVRSEDSETLPKGRHVFVRKELEVKS